MASLPLLPFSSKKASFYTTPLQTSKCWRRSAEFTAKASVASLDSTAVLGT